MIDGRNEKIRKHIDRIKEIGYDNTLVDEDYVSKVSSQCHHILDVGAGLNIDGICREIISQAAEYKRLARESSRARPLARIRRLVGSLVVAP